MIDIHFENNNSGDRIRAFQEALGGTLTTDCEEHVLHLDPDNQDYIIRGVDLDFGLSMLQMHVPAQDHSIRIVYSGHDACPLEILYLTKGELIISEQDVMICNIKSNNSLTYASEGCNDYAIEIPKNTEIKLVILDFKRDEYIEKIECNIDTLHPSLQHLFRDTVALTPFRYDSPIDKVTINAITSIFNSDKTGLEKKLLTESHVNKLISNFMKNMRNKLEPAANNYRYDDEDIKLIEAIRDRIEDNPKVTYTVSELSRRAGINPNKLQKGFKMLYGMPIRQYIIKNKLKYAVTKLEEGHYRIGEIVDDLGYVNKGHFTALFQKEFGMLPSEYRNKNAVKV